MPKRIPTHEAAEAVLRETNNPAVMWGDCGLLDLIFFRTGLSEKSGVNGLQRIFLRQRAVINNLSRNHGNLVPRRTSANNGKKVRIFWLPEHAPTPKKGNPL